MVFVTNKIFAKVWKIDKKDKYADGNDCLRAGASHAKRSSLCIISVESRDGRYHETEERHLEAAIENIEAIIEGLDTCHI